jgi:hypothetical protein
MLIAAGDKAPLMRKEIGTCRAEKRGESEIKQ